MSESTEAPKPKPAPRKRTPVPKMEKAKEPPLLDEVPVAVPEEESRLHGDFAENTSPVVTPVYNPKENKMDKIKALVINNQDTIKRKLIVAVGTGLGMLIASTVIDTLGQRKPDVVYLEVPIEPTEPVDTPAS